SSPARALVILRRSVPTHGSRYKNWLSQITIVDCFLELDDVRSRAILKEHAEFYSRFLTCVDQSIGALSSYVDGLLNQNVQAVSCGCDSVLGVQPGWRTDENRVHRAMSEKSFEVLVRSGAGSVCRPRNLLGVLPADGYYLNALDLARRSGVSLTYIAASQNPYVKAHVQSSAFRLPVPQNAS